MTLGQEVRDRMQDQVLRQSSRDIFKKVRDARNETNALRRWIWELVQNAVDSTAETGNKVGLEISFANGRLKFEHDGDPFRYEHLAALITGGSSKPFESERYAGQFGSGFLVTHVLSYDVLVEGIVKESGDPQYFTFVLNRKGDEETIHRNIDNCFNELDQGSTADFDSSHLRARFTYDVGAEDRQILAISVGISALEKLLPYVFGFAERLASVRIDNAGQLTTWHRKDPVIESTANAGIVREIPVCRVADDHTTEFRLLLATDAIDKRTQCAALANIVGESVVVRPPDADTPRLFSPYPLSGTTSLALPVIINSSFSVDEERREIYLNEQQTDNRRKVNDGLALIPGICEYSAARGWQQAHLLAGVKRVRLEEDSEANWWNQSLKELVIRSLRAKPLVRGEDGLLPSSAFVFPIPAVLENSTTELTFDKVWTLVHRAYPNTPAKEIANDWQQIVKDWRNLGVPVTEIRTIGDLIEEARDKQSLKRLAQWLRGTEEDAIEWLKCLYGLMAEHAENNQGAFPQELLQDAFPNQKGNLCSAQSLKRDPGLSVQLKDIADSLGLDTRNELLYQGILENTPPKVLSFIISHIPGQKEESDVLDSLVAKLQKSLPNDKRVTATDNSLKASIVLLGWLAADSDRYVGYARRIPLLTRAGVLRSAGQEPIFVLPVSQWESAAQRYPKVFPDPRVLSAAYADQLDIDTAFRLFDAFVAWRIAYPRQLLHSEGARLDEKSVQALLVDANAGAHDLNGLQCSAIPFLNEVIGATSQSPQRAKEFLEFLLEYVVPNDKTWCEPIVFRCDCEMHREKQLKLYPSEWFAQVRVRHWVATPGEEKDRIVSLQASKETLEPLIEAWERVLANDYSIQFLTTLGFDRLELILRKKVGSDTQAMHEIREQLASLVTLAGSEPEKYVEIVSGFKAKTETKDRVAQNRKMGLQVQELVRIHLEQNGFQVELIDCGYDFEVFEKGEAEIESDLGRLRIGKQFLEVKATNSNEVKMTCKQGSFAAEHVGNYSLCVVDLTKSSSPCDVTQMCPSDLEPLISVVSDIGQKLSEAHSWVEIAGVGTDEIRVENMDQVRYGVQRKVWERGISMSEWIQQIRDASERSSATSVR